MQNDAAPSPWQLEISRGATQPGKPARPASSQTQPSAASPLPTHRLRRRCWRSLACPARSPWCRRTGEVNRSDEQKEVHRTEGRLPSIAASITDPSRADPHIAAAVAADGCCRASRLLVPAGRRSACLSMHARHTSAACRPSLRVRCQAAGAGLGWQGARRVGYEAGPL